MPRDVNGNVTLPTNDSSPAAPRNVIRSSDINELMGDLAAMMQDSLSRSGDGGMLSALDMGGFDLTNTASVYMKGGNNLSDISNEATSRANLGVNLNFAGAASGGDDTTTISDFITTGLPLYLDKGQTYNIGTVSIPSGTRLYLNGGTLLANPGTADALLKLASGATDIIIQGPGTIDCNGVAPYGIFGEGIALETIKVLGCTIIDPTLDGVRLREGRDVEVCGNTIKTPGQHGVTITSSLERFTINNNIVTNPGGAGVIFSVGKKGSVSGNKISGAGPSGDGITGYAVDNEDISIVSNIIDGSENHGIHVGGKRLALTSNIVNGASANNGIFIGATDTGSSGGTNMPSEDCTVTGNIVTGSLIGMNFRDTKDSAINSNTVNGSTSHQILLVTSDDNTVSDNVVSDGGASGIVLRGSSDNNVVGNRTRGHVADGYRTEVSGATNSLYNSFVGNRSKSDNRGFVEGAGSDLNTFSANRVRLSTAEAFILTGASSLLNNVPLYASSVVNPSSLADGAGETFTVTVTGARVGDFVDVSFSVALSDVMLLGWVSANDTVSARFQNESGGVRDLSAGTLRVRVIRSTTGA